MESEEEDLPDTQDVNIDNVGFEDDTNMSDDEMNDAAWKNAKNDKPAYDPSEMNDIFDSVKARKLNEEGTKLNSFGKHVGYRKKPMTLPATGSDKNEFGEDWNDASVYSEQPFGEKIGSSAPYEQIVKEAIESVLANFKKKI